MPKGNSQLGTGKFLAIMGGVLLLTFLGKLLFALGVGCIAYFIFGFGFETASFVSIMAYIIPTFIIDTYDLIPKKKKSNHPKEN